MGRVSDRPGSGRGDLFPRRVRHTYRGFPRGESLNSPRTTRAYARMINIIVDATVQRCVEIDSFWYRQDLLMGFHPTGKTGLVLYSTSSE